MAKIRNNYEKSWFPRLLKWLDGGSGLLDDAMAHELDEGSEEHLLPDSQDALTRETKFEQHRQESLDKDETLYDAGQLYRTLRSSITDNYPLAGVLIPEWNMGSYISQTQLASLLGVDDTATSLQSMNDFQLDLKKIKKVQPENAKAGYLYFRLETDDTAADSPVLTLGVEKSGLLRAASPAVHILLDIPAHGIHTELTGTVTPAAPALTAPTSRMQDSDIASLVQLRQTVESVVQFVQGSASGTQSAS